ncbi:MAG: hypothetical protein U9N56_11870 [Actinomycetota bacterium]|nr:hypothetical protein [Actinomycetota bacterium]
MKGVLPIALLLVIAGCAADTDPPAATAAVEDTTPTQPTNTTTEATTTTSSDGTELFPDVIDVVITPSGDGTYRIDTTLSSPYDSPARYADAWRVKSADGTAYGVRELAHDHAGEQPFTRSLSGVEIPADVTAVIVEGRDQVSGWGGQTVEIDLPDR